MHHLEGKHADLFQTLCHNCHMSHHAGDSGQITYQDELKWFAKKEEERKLREDRDKKILELYQNNFEILHLSRMFNLSETRISQIVKQPHLTSRSESS